MQSHFHYHTFVCNIFYTLMRSKVGNIFGSDFLQFDSISVAFHCHAALKMLWKDSVHYEKLLAHRMSFIVESDEMLVVLQDIHSRLILGQAGAIHRELGEVLVEVSRLPTLGVGIERNHKVNKGVHSALRSRTDGGKVEKQIAIAHNSRQDGRGMDQKRSGYEQFLRKAIRLAESTGGLRGGGTGTVVVDGDGLGEGGDEDAEDVEDYHIEALLSGKRS